MTVIRDIFAHERILPLESQGALLGDAQAYLLTSGTAAGIADLRHAYRPTETAVDVGSVDEIILRLTEGAGDYKISMHDWTSLDDASAGDTLTENGGTGLRVYAEGSSSEWVLVGRTEGNQVLVQTGTYTTSDAVNVAIHTVSLLGGLLDMRLRSAAGRHRICMVTRSSTEPQSPGSRPHYTGRSLRNATVGGATWHQAGAIIPAGTDTLWFAFGEARFNPLRGQWVVSERWVVVDATDTDYSIEYAPAWTGLWNQDPYAVATSKYARYRDPGGSQRVRRIGNDLFLGDRDWVLAWELDVPSTGSVWDTLRADANFDFYPDDFRLMRLDYEFDSLTSTVDEVVERSLASLLFSPSILRPNLASRSTTRQMMVRVQRQGSASGISVGYTSQVAGRIGNSGSSQGFLLAAVGGSDGSLPITEFTVPERGNQTNSGTLRLWAL